MKIIEHKEAPLVESASYRIRWQTRELGRSGTGTKVFTEAEALALAQELNAEYPHIEHEAVKI